MSEAPNSDAPGIIGWLLRHRLLAVVLAALWVAGGIYVSPFQLDALDGLPRDPVAVDALPDTGDNQQIVFTEWPGRSPQDVEDQITYPLTTALMGIPGVRTVRSTSAFGFSSIYVIFTDDVEFYWSRSRVLEKLAALPPGTLPEEVRPTLGPDATAMGQIFWYTLEGQDAEGHTVGGFDQDELRAAQDWIVRYALQAVEGVSEVASVGGFVREYQITLDPEAMRARGVTLNQVAAAVRGANLDVGARTLEINGVEYVIRGVGLIRGAEDLEATALTASDGAAVRLGDVSRITMGPALRRGALDDAGAPAVGGVVVARFGANPQTVLDGLQVAIDRMKGGLPRRTLEDGTVSQITLVPFYDRGQLIQETLGTLSTALYQQILITVIVVLIMMGGLGVSALISATVPLGVLGTLMVMRLAGVEANIMALGGVAIAIGTMVDVGIVFTEAMQRRLDDAPDQPRRPLIAAAVSEVAPAVITSVLTTVVGFLPVFGLTASELRLFGPLAVTKTVAMVMALVVAVIILPGLAAFTLRGQRPQRAAIWRRLRIGLVALAVIALVALLADDWRPLQADLYLDLIFVGALLALVLVAFRLFERAYPTLLRWILAHKALSLSLPAALLVAGGLAYGTLGRAYMPPFDEGAFLYMPTTTPHASMAEALTMLSDLDAAVAAIPEVDRAVGKLGRVESPLDPAPISMFEILITYHPEYSVDAEGHRVRQWRDHIRTPDDIWTEIAEAAAHPGVTGAPILMPISARQVMLQSGMRSPMGVKIQGPDLATIEGFATALEALLKSSPVVRKETVFAERIVGKPYLEIRMDRDAIARHGLSVATVQGAMQMALGGATLSRALDGRARYDIRARYGLDDRRGVESIGEVLIPAPSGAQIPLGQLAEITYVRGPQMIKSEDTFLTGYVLFDKTPEAPEVEAAEQVQALIADHIAQGHLEVPEGVRFELAGTYEQQVRSEARLMWLVPLALVVIFMLLYVQSHEITTALIVYSGVAVAVAGGFILLWLYNQPWFLDVRIGGVDLREIFQVDTVRLSVAVWVGFIALAGIATDDGVVMSTYLRQRFEADPPTTVAAIRARTLEAGAQRVRPCLMTTATTLLALLPVITSSGKGADVMMPMALPCVGGMVIELVTLFVVPILYCARAERRLSA